MTDTRPRTAQPNFAARRMLVSAAAITAMVAAGAGVWQATRGDDPTPTATAATWDALAIVGTATGDIVLLDPSGTVVAQYDGDSRVSTVHAAGSQLALVHTDAVSLVDVAAGADSSPRDIPLPERARQVTRLATERQRLLLAGGSRNGGNIRVVDGETGGSYDVADLAGLRNPLLYTGRTLRVDPEGTTVAVADANSFQTIVVTGLGTDDDEPPAVANYAAQPLAVGDGLLATSQVVGGRADVSVHPLGGDPSAPVPMGIPAGGMIADRRLLAVTTEGAVVAVRVGDRQPRQLSTLNLPPDATVTAAYPAASGTRLVVYADSYAAVLDTDGTILFERTLPPGTGGLTGAPRPTETTNPATPTSSTPGTATGTTAPVTSLAPDADTGARAEPLVPAWEWTCLAVGIGTRGATLIALDDGAELADLGRVTVTGASADGCTIVGTDRDETVVLGEAGRAELGEAREALVSPDGRLVVVRRATSTELVALDDELRPADPIDVTEALPARSYSVAFVER